MHSNIICKYFLVWHQAAKRFTSFTNVFSKHILLHLKKSRNTCINYASEKILVFKCGCVVSIHPPIKKKTTLLERNATLPCLQPMLLGATCRDCSTKTDMVRSNDLPPTHQWPIVFGVVLLEVGKLGSLVMVPLIPGLLILCCFWVGWSLEMEINSDFFEFFGSFRGELLTTQAFFVVTSFAIFAHCTCQYFWCCVF